MARKIECDNCGKQRKGKYYTVTIIAVEHGKLNEPKAATETKIPDCCSVCLKALKKGAPPKRRGRKPIVLASTGGTSQKKKTAAKKKTGQGPTPPQKPVIPSEKG